LSRSAISSGATSAATPLTASGVRTSSRSRPARAGWLYLAAVQDLFSCRIVGWSMDRHMRSELVIVALEMALRRRRPSPGLIHHSDHGSQRGLNRSSQQCL
jgi:transposase InsO family protein